MKVIILAAGYATRLYPLTKNLPKALLPVGEKTILDLLLQKVAEISDVSSVTLVTNHKFAAVFDAYFRKLKNEFLPWQIKVLDDGTGEESIRLGALGDLKLALNQLGYEEDVLVLASDNLFEFSLRQAYLTFKRLKKDMVVGQSLENCDELSRFAIAEVDAGGIITSLEEKPANPKSNIVVYATYFYKAETLPLLLQYESEGNNMDSPGRFPAWLYKRKPIYLYRIEEKCIDIGTVESYAAIKDTWQ